MVGSINGSEMDQFSGLGGFDGTAHVLGATEEVAAGHPPGGLPFSEDDGVEVLAVGCLHRQGASAFLVQIFQGDPDLQGLLAKIDGERFGHDPCVRAVQDQPPTTDHGAASGLPVHGTAGIAQVFLEAPLGHGRGYLIGPHLSAALGQGGPRPGLHLGDLPGDPLDGGRQAFLFRVARGQLDQVRPEVLRRGGPGSAETGADLLL